MLSIDGLFQQKADINALVGVKDPGGRGTYSKKN